MKNELSRILKKFGYKQEALLPCLHLVQKKSRFISEEVVSYLAQALNLPKVEIYATISFYSMFTFKNQGKNIIRVCVSLPCYIKKSQKILETLKGELGIGEGETTKDGKYTIEGVSCLGACDQAPVMMVNEKLYGNLTEEKIKKILAQVK